MQTIICSLTKSHDDCANYNFMLLLLLYVVVTTAAAAAALLLLFRPHICCFLWFLRHLRRSYLLIRTVLFFRRFYLFGSQRFVRLILVPIFPSTSIMYLLLLYCCCCCCCCCCCSACHHRRFLMVPLRVLCCGSLVRLSSPYFTYFVFYNTCTYRVNFTRE